jgi:hypothetical protein
MERIAKDEARKERLGVPLSQLELFVGEESARQAAEDWRYWVQRGYRF